MDAGTVYYTDFSKEFLFQILRGPLRTVILKNYLLSTFIESLNFSMMYLLRYTVTFRNKNWFSAQVSVKLPGWRAVVRRLAALRGQLPAPRPGPGTPQGPRQRTGLPSNCQLHICLQSAPRFSSVSSSSGGGLTDDSGIHTFNSSSVDGNDKNAKKSIRKLPATPATKKTSQASVVKIRDQFWKPFRPNC